VIDTCVPVAVAREPVTLIASLSARATWSSVSPAVILGAVYVVPPIVIDQSSFTPSAPFSATSADEKEIGVTLSVWSAVVERVTVPAGVADCVTPSCDSPLTG
jgi:hypothetical protein